jgi:hypothetical protein
MSVPKRMPLNGTKTHPLSAHAIGVLRQLARGSLFGCEINPGVRDRLWRESLAEPDEEGRGTRVWTITAAGRARLAKIDRGAPPK